MRGGGSVSALPVDKVQQRLPGPQPMQVVGKLRRLRGVVVLVEGGQEVHAVPVVRDGVDQFTHPGRRGGHRQHSVHRVEVWLMSWPAACRALSRAS
mgnify:CR=1 FL=1